MSYTERLTAKWSTANRCRDKYRELVELQANAPKPVLPAHLVETIIPLED